LLPAGRRIRLGLAVLVDAQPDHTLRPITLSGLRNHKDPRDFDLIEWLAENAKRSYGLLGLLFTRDFEDVDRIYDVDSQFRVFRLSCAGFAEMQQLVDFPLNIAPPPFECEGFDNLPPGNK
jgi:hypothetical protein